MLETITKHWLTQAEGWRTLDRQSEYPFADLVAVKESDEDEAFVGETVLVVCAADANIERGFCSALGRLVLMMDRDFEVNAFGLPRPNPRLKPPLVRYVLAVPTDSAWLPLLRACPDLIRKMLHLIILRVSDEELIKYLPSVSV
ncbi:MAG: hypothetical protein KDA78_17975 [Planctomycetaceae bacterium]|nr:hypothetical protein [Planctomycetaceae bacterium]